MFPYTMRQVRSYAIVVKKVTNRLTTFGTLNVKFPTKLISFRAAFWNINFCLSLFLRTCLSVLHAVIAQIFPTVFNLHLFVTYYSLSIQYGLSVAIFKTLKRVRNPGTAPFWVEFVVGFSPWLTSAAENLWSRKNRIIARVFLQPVAPRTRLGLSLPKSILIWI